MVVRSLGETGAGLADRRLPGGRHAPAEGGRYTGGCLWRAAWEEEGPRRWIALRCPLHPRGVSLQ